MKNFHDLKVWQKAHLLTLAVYQATRGFPPRRIVWADEPTATLQFLCPHESG